MVAAPFQFLRQYHFGKLHQVRSLIRGYDTDHTGAVTMQWNQSKRSGFGMELAGNIVVRRLMAELGYKSGLWIIPLPHRNTGGGAHHRMPSICTNDQIGIDGTAVIKPHCHAIRQRNIRHEACFMHKI